ncbi:MAG: hypothetical protein WD757_03290 [Actinomycetota bacterium]
MDADAEAPLTAWEATWRYVAGIPVILLIGWFAFIHDRPVPILSGLDLATHEFGHFAVFWAPRLVVLAMGSLFQIAFPLSIAVYFAFKREWLGAGLCAAWAGAACHAVSLYIADAPYGALPLIGTEHDWSAILYEFSAVHRAASLAAFVKDVGVVFWTGGLALCAAGPYFVRRKREHTTTDEAHMDDRMRQSAWAVVPPWDRRPRT